jgi:hypothetical protein
MLKWAILPLLAAASFVFAQNEKIEKADAWSKTVPTEDNNVFEQILEYRKKGDFERAIAVAVETSNGRRPDDFLLQATAVTYFQRAQADQMNKEKWVDLAVQYSKDALDAKPNDLVNVFNLGDSYMAAGMNLSKPVGCSYYGKSLLVFDSLKADPSLQGEWGTIEGKRVQLTPYRAKLDEHIANLRRLAIGCSGF